MDRRSLGVIATILATLMVVVGTAGLDDLPRSLRASAASAPNRLAADRQALEQNQAAVEKLVQEDPALFGEKAPAYKVRLEQDRARLEQAAARVASIEKLAKANRRRDMDEFSRSLSDFESLRQAPVRDSAALRAETEKALYDKLHPFDREAALAPVRKAMVDWPDKKADLETRLPSVQDANSASALNALVHKLYVSWDKLLVDLEGDRQRVKIVRTEDAQTSSEERTEPRQFASDRGVIGLVIEHKPLGRYDTESERSAQPPAYAYIAPPGESNRYGHWSGGVWQWLPAYLILSQMLHMSRGPVTTRDYDGWREGYRRGLPPPVVSGPAPRSWFPPSGTLKSPGGQQSSSGWWKERPKPSWGDTRSFDGSKYKSKGSFGGSRYQSKGTFRSFGRAGRR